MADSGELLWDSGKVKSCTMHATLPHDVPPKTKVLWKVRLWDESDKVGEWAEAFFETGINHWQAKWITGNDHVNSKRRYPVDCFRKTFDANDVKKARMYITACGLYEAKLNGARVGNFVLAPGITDYRKRVQAQTYDVTAQLRNGKNLLTVQLADAGLEVFSDRSDAKTFRPTMRKLAEKHGKRYEETVADAGYESLENYLYLAQNGQICFIKPTNYDQKKTKKYKGQIGRIENMAYSHDDDCFICTQGRKLRLRREMTEQRDGQFVTTAWYRSEDCAGCPCRAQCCRAKDPNQPKEIVLQRTFWEKREQATRNISSGRGIHLRLCRSIQVEGAFALLKNDFGFRRFLTRGKRNIRTELFFLVLAFDLKKLWMKREHNRLKTRESGKMVS